MQFNKFMQVSVSTLCLIGNATGFPACAETSLPTQSGEHSASRRNHSKTSLSETLKQIVDNPERPLSGLSVLVVKHGKITYDGNFGFRQIDETNPRKNLKVDRNTKFRVASLSKLETAIGIMELVEQNKINLDEDAGHYLGFRFRNPNYPEIPVTVRMLLSHTSSMRDGDNYTFPPTETLAQALVAGGKNWENGAHWAAAADRGNEVAPGKFFAYSNLNYGVLGTIIEAVSGERFDKYMRAHVLLPLGCKASYNVQDLSKSQLKELSVLYCKKDDHDKWDPHGKWYAQKDDYRTVPFSQPDGWESYIPGKNATWMSPQGGLRISAVDLSRVMRMFLNGGEFNGVRILSPETVKLMFTPQWTYDSTKHNGETNLDLWHCYGLGPHILTNSSQDRLLEKRDLPMMGHIGDAWGLLGCLMMDFKRKDGFICIMSGVGADPEKNRGSYSGFFRWEEEIVTAIYGSKKL